jgi:hypothetical protein
MTALRAGATYYIIVQTYISFCIHIIYIYVYIYKYTRRDCPCRDVNLSAKVGIGLLL